MEKNIQRFPDKAQRIFRILRSGAAWRDLSEIKAVADRIQ